MKEGIIIIPDKHTVIFIKIIFGVFLYCILSPSKREYQHNLRQNLNADHGNSKIMSYQAKPVQAPEGMYAKDNLEIFF